MVAHSLDLSSVLECLCALGMRRPGLNEGFLNSSWQSHMPFPSGPELEGFHTHQIL